MSGRLHPKASFTENAPVAIASRLAGMMELAAAFDDPAAAEDLHNLRIAAKRLRYALELFEPCLPGSKPILRRLSDLQEMLGAIHDLDVLAAILRERLTILDGDLERDAVEIMGGEGSPREKSSLLQARLFAQARDPRRLGVLGLLGDKIAEREKLFAKAQQRWGAGGLETLADQIRVLINQPVAPHDAGEDATPATTS